MFVLVILIAVVLTGVALWFARRGASVHQEDLNTHGGRVEPAGRRPADADAEAMGVERPGQPGADQPGA